MNEMMLIGVVNLVVVMIAIGFFYRQSSKSSRDQVVLEALTTQLQQLSQHQQQGLLALQSQFQQLVMQSVGQSTQQLEQRLENFGKEWADHRQKLTELQVQQVTMQQTTLQQTMQDVRHQLHTTLSQNAGTIGEQLKKLTQETDLRLKEISGQVERRLSEGFEKTTTTFTEIVKRLALIDQAQQKITELSNNVVTLQDLLSDKRARGALGEVQLSALIRNMMPESHFSLQHTLKNGKRVDCILFLPSPTGHVAIDAKYPLETYRKLASPQLTEAERRGHEQQFRQDIRKHIQDIATKYIVPGETADGAIMFIPAEAIFAEIHAHYPELVDEAHQARVWLASPTTLMAILTTARAVIKDEATRHQIHIIRDHLRLLAVDFERFQKRMDQLARHIEQANTDVKEVQISAHKITTRFGKIEQVELQAPEASSQLASSDLPG